MTSAAVLIRVAKRKTALNAMDAEEFYEAEFRTPGGDPDTSLSIYEIIADDDVRTQANAEHVAGCGLDPPRRKSSSNFVLTGLIDGEIQPTPGNPWFRFTREAHREAQFAGQEALVGLARRLLQAGDDRVLKSSKDEMKSFVASCVEAADEEWLKFLESSVKGPKWRMWAKK